MQNHSHTPLQSAQEVSLFRIFNYNRGFLWELWELWERMGVMGTMGVMGAITNYRHFSFSR